ncbi:hypothetical protein HUN03_00298 [Mycoplasmopsis anatis]|uniref:MurR/RpiR family transcriptional regulator n=1 Tax=Mycoplasmopsis anatis TaxID=171279 RepID=UPI001C4DDDF1|nr:MurR/RpiR family transcriptional regulator [Mycoplasmopsis anatis]MBW0594744.1 hypothetical protein [Mycoplasmopsis anatis]MBW0595210.1 hypothetical protein [Mycoplasmopsis anatis]MBW0596756.1 hypothetical protein [Mycoplasmopsis anatis]MBW0597198.1 hypothetical protein [Mycoplasmopsis anatis]MBW0598307.1 hypothetical protein [Mycoplasmopsis anatis]
MKQLIEVKYLDKISSNETYKYITNFIEEDPDFFLKTSIANLAKHLYVSQPTITRYVKALGFKSYSHFRIYISERKSTYKYGNIKIIEGKDLTYEQILNNVWTHFKYASEHSYDWTVAHHEDIGQYLKFLIRSKRVIFFGIGESGLVCDYLAYNLRKTGMLATSINSVHDFFGIYKTITNNDFLTIISRSFETLEVLKVRDICEKYKLYYSIWTKNENIEKLNARNIIQLHSLDQTKRIGSIGSKISMFFFADLIYFYIANRIDHDDKDIFENITIERNSWNNKHDNKKSSL